MTKATKFSEEELNPISEYCTLHPKLYEVIAEEMTKINGEENGCFFRQEIGSWLNPDLAQRTEPRLGNGILLIRVARHIIRAHKRLEKRKKA